MDRCADGGHVWSPTHRGYYDDTWPSGAACACGALRLSQHGDRFFATVDVATAERRGFELVADKIVELMRRELAIAETMFKRFNSPHEGKAVIEEELDELWDLVKANQGKTVQAMCEAIQVGAMAARYVLSIGAVLPSGATATVAAIEDWLVPREQKAGIR